MEWYWVAMIVLAASAFIILAVMYFDNHEVVDTTEYVDMQAEASGKLKSDNVESS